jgi:hypothetical protein
VGINNDGNPVKGFRIGNESVQKWLNEIKNKTVCPLNVYKENLKKSLCY